MRTPKNVEEYYSWFPQEAQDAMDDVKRTIYEVMPDAEESISYAIPTYKYKGLLAHFAAYEKHIGLYPGSEAIVVFAEDIAANKFKSAKGSIQFPLNKPMPLDLVRKIVEYRLQENLKAPKKSK
ncbi:iron chaperone [Mucilaginibacter pedocola]|uniref:YdhG-like domain-containing protein n=1 Tax=Mucilaginibacter pedocola TaxID=1792845 RepID=A0A1S9P9C5_9SPHI|nr:DUF1801 domain-containing protein [Mucilaginibacter pedocola]OOQ57560.1 hypothetical protein BC343_12190 [Mucilaginibacter pedocola]